MVLTERIHPARRRHRPRAGNLAPEGRARLGRGKKLGRLPAPDGATKR